MKYRKWSLEEKLEILSSSEELGISIIIILEQNMSF